MTNPYFVDITTEKSPFECYQKIKTAAENDSSAITPELCLDILQSTNYPPVISAMVKRAAFAIEGDTRRYLNFRRVLLGAVAQRESSEETRRVVYAMTERYHDKAAYERAVHSEAGKFLLQGYRCQYGLNLQGSAAQMNLRYHDFSGYDKLVFDGNVRQIDLGHARNLPKRLDLSSAEKAETISLNCADLSGVEKLELPRGIKKADFSRVRNMPDAAFDLQKYERLREAGFAALDFAGKPLLKLPGQIEKVDLRGAKNLSRRTDLRACSRLKEVNAEGIAGEAEFLLPDESQAQVRRRGRNVRRVMQPLPSWAAYYRGRAA